MIMHRSMMNKMFKVVYINSFYDCMPNGSYAYDVFTRVRNKLIIIDIVSRLGMRCALSIMHEKWAYLEMQK